MSEKAALELALDVIKSYQAHIQEGITARRVAKGFCQGRLYANALDMIERARSAK